MPSKRPSHQRQVHLRLSDRDYDAYSHELSEAVNHWPFLFVEFYAPIWNGSSSDLNHL